ncbi:hypothetical protein ABOK31_23395 [Rhizobium sp. ZPR4]|uniref:CsbD family protein n=1 Tax=Rhizobium sp. ZPR4 TaxID=3158966 RepID=A0AAU7SM63_9HYPH
MTGNNRLKIEGAAEKVEGKILAQVGKAKDPIDTRFADVKRVRNFAPAIYRGFQCFSWPSPHR